MRRTLLAASLVAALCLPDAAFAVNTGSANFTHYVSAGDSLTAGFTSGSLIETSQLVDYPALIDLAATGNNSGFEQPLVSAPGIPAILQLHGLFPTIIAPASGIGEPLNLTLGRPYDNLAVPGETVHSMINTVTDHGGLHDLILRGLGTQLQQVAGSSPTFITLWIGNNDALAAATSGIVIDGVTLTTLDSFTADYTTIVKALAATGAKMAIANIPDVTTIPFVNTIPSVVVNPANNEVVLGPDGQPIPLLGPNGPLGPGDHVLLSAATDLAHGLGVPIALGGTGEPLTDSDVLSAAETSTIQARVVQFNQVIASQANAVGAALVDMNTLLTRLATTGVQVGGLTFNSSFLTGGVFAYDGVHPTHFGYAYTANAWISAINAKFGAKIPPANLANAIFDGGVAKNEGSVVSTSSTHSIAKPSKNPIDAVLTQQAIKNLFWAMGWPTDPVAPPPAKHRKH
jgi:lysophospholipase L1-like esterase